MKTALVLGGGGFIGGHLAKRLKNEGFWVRVVDIKKSHDFFENKYICDEYLSLDLRKIENVETSFKLEKNDSFDEVYQLAADMGGAGYIFTGENDANVMHNSALINLNVAFEASKYNTGKIFYSSSACMYPAHNQMDPSNPNCEESSAYPANPDSEYGWEKLFSERIYFAFNKNYNLNCRVARFHNIYGPYGTWDGGKEKAPAAMCRKVAAASNNSSIEVWGNGQQTRSFMYIEDCIEAVLRFVRQDNFKGPVNIGSEEMVTINRLAEIAINVSNKKIQINNLHGDDFKRKYGFECPLGVKGRNSDNKLYFSKMNWSPKYSLERGIKETYNWIQDQLKLSNNA